MFLDLIPIYAAFQTLARAKADPRLPLSLVEVVAYLDGVCIMEPERRGEYMDLLTALDHTYRELLAEVAEEHPKPD